jgi:hypothetical protein
VFITTRQWLLSGIRWIQFISHNPDYLQYMYYYYPTYVWVLLQVSFFWHLHPITLPIPLLFWR